MSKYKSALPTLPKRGWFDKGDKGEEVKKLQRALNWANDGTIVAKLNVDGIVGPLTIQAVSFFEEIQHLSIDGQFGKKCRAKIASMDLNGATRACNWAVSVAKDNRFSYGTGKRAHRCGCYFCQTNTGPRKKNKERKGEPHVVKDSKGNGHTYEMTYCCNTFITAAYAHGAKDAKVLKLCKACGAMGMKPKDWTSRNFKNLGRAKSVAYSKLQPGDVIINDGSGNSVANHVWMYIGDGKLIEATSSGGWGAKAIASKGGAKSKYTKYQKSSKCYVLRYTK